MLFNLFLMGILAESKANVQFKANSSEETGIISQTGTDISIGTYSGDDTDNTKTTPPEKINVTMSDLSSEVPAVSIKTNHIKKTRAPTM